MRKLAILFLLTAALSFGQVRWNYNQTITGTGSPVVVTVQQPDTPSAEVAFEVATITCPVACTFTIEQGEFGSAASGTPLDVDLLRIEPRAAAPPIEVYQPSNASTGIIVWNYISPGGVYRVNLQDVRLLRNQAKSQLTIRTGAITGDVNIQVKGLSQ